MQSDIRGDRTGYAVVGEAKIAGLQAPQGADYRLGSLLRPWRRVRDSYNFLSDILG
jgi:hypothetical protein